MSSRSARRRRNRRNKNSGSDSTSTTGSSTPVTTAPPKTDASDTGSEHPTLTAAAETGVGDGPKEFDFYIEGRDFQNDGTLAEKSNAVAVPPKPDSPADGVGYVATLPTTASGKNKAPLAVAEQYEAEAFDDPTTAASRLAMVVGVNGFFTATEDPATTEGELQKHVDEVAGFGGFRLHAFSQRWSRKWKRKSTNKHVPVADVWKEIKDDPTLIAEAKEEETAAAANKKTAYKGVINWARNQVTAHPKTGAELKNMSEHWSRAMMHVADPDAINLKAEKEPGKGEHGLLDRWDEVLKDKPGAKVATGGYSFREKGVGDDPHASGAAKALPQTKQASDLDMRVRDTMSTVDSGMPYFPEPNLMIDAELILGMSEKDRAKLWGKDGAEWPKAKANLGVDSSEMLFDKRATLFTDAGRFDDTFVKLDGDMAKGKTAPGPLFDNAASQSHAKTGVIKGKLETLVGDRKSPLIKPLLDAFLPQELLNLDAAADATTFAALKGMLETMRDNAEKAAGVIKSTEWSAVERAGKLDPAKMKGVLEAASVNTELTGNAKFVAAVGSAIQHKGGAADLDKALLLMQELCKTIAGFLLDFVPQAPTTTTDT